MRWSKRKIFLPVFAFLFLSLPLFSLAADTFTGKVVGVSDGDTISVIRGRLKNGKAGKTPSILTLAMAFCFVMVSLAQAEESEEKLSIPQSAEMTREAREELTLVGIASIGGVWRAVINDEIVKVGSVIKGYEVLGIYQQGMTVEYDGYWAWIPLDKRFD